MDKEETKIDATWYDETPANSSGVVNSCNGLDASQESQPRVPFNLSDIYYTMTGNKYLHIFNHFEYAYDDPVVYEKKKRHGTGEDVKALWATFDALGFKVSDHHDLHYQDILKEMKKVWTSDHSTTSCVAVAILTHGRNGGYLLAADTVEYHLSELTDMMASAHPSLAGKPKLWFIQACRSSHYDDQRENNITKPMQDDTLMLYSSSPHFYSYRCPTNGAWMIKHLCEVLNQYHKSFDILQMLTFVNQYVAGKATTSLDPRYANKKQMPETEHTLQKLLKF